MRAMKKRNATYLLTMVGLGLGITISLGVSLGDAGCSNNPPSTAMDMATPGGADMTVFSCCGKMGDTGNTKGVGKYCMVSGDCAGNPMATICSSIGNTGMTRKTFFCTYPCQADMGDCGPDAECVFDTAQGAAGCVPTLCNQNRPPGC